MAESCCQDTRSGVKRAWRVGGAAALILAGVALGWLVQPIASIGAYACAILILIVSPIARAVRSVRARAVDINVLMVIASIGAAILGDWLEAASVLWLFGVAQVLESFSLERAQRAIRSLLMLTPAEALVRRDDTDQMLAVSAIAINDVVIVRPGERIAVDGVVIRGASTVNQAPVTGESFPVDRTPGDVVFAGSINGNGALEVRALKAAADSTIAHVARLVEAAHRQRAPIQTFVDRFSRRYTPAVIGIAIIVAVVPPLVTGGGSAAFATWVYRALALLVVACPCALVISTPVSIVAALAAAAREGVLIKGGAHLERLGAIRCVALDKTGTLTRAELSVTDVVGVDGASAHGVLSVAAALESRSEHPIGRAIVMRAQNQGVLIPAGEDFRALPGLGAEARVDSLPAIVGSHRLFEERRLCTPALHIQIDRVVGLGGTAVLVGHAGAAMGVIAVADEPRAGARSTLAALRREGVERIVLLSGDGHEKVAATRHAHDLDAAHGGLMPAEKAAIIRKLREEVGPVAMVGDGINDAPALAAADVGIAMGAAGSDVAIEAADVALMSDDLTKLPYALRLGRATLANIRTNVAVALGLKIAFIALAAAGMATLWMAIVADTGASLLVTANGLRLLKFKS
jgi:Cd2+/Zn2+-exporting ATPase